MFTSAKTFTKLCTIKIKNTILKTKT